MQGIYKIENTKNSKVYIGSSKDVEQRWKQHLHMLNTNTHHSVKLQAAWNRAKDKSVFVFSVIEEVQDAAILLDREQYWTDYYDAYHKGYACTEKVNNPKYATKNQLKSKRKLMAIQEYERFEQLFPMVAYVDIAKKIQQRIDKQIYKWNGIKAINDTLERVRNLKYNTSYYYRLYMDGMACCVSVYNKEPPRLLYTLKGKDIIYEPNWESYSLTPQNN